jgi:hypothetical protein
MEGTAYPYGDDELRKVARDAYFPGKAAGTRCPGSVPTDRCGCAVMAVMWRYFSQSASPRRRAVWRRQQGAILMPDLSFSAGMHTDPRLDENSVLKQAFALVRIPRSRMKPVYAGIIL